MNKACLQVTYRRGKPRAAYRSIGSRNGRHVATSKERGPVVIDSDADGNILGFELYIVTAETVELLKQQLIEHHFRELSEGDLQPLLAT